MIVTKKAISRRTVLRGLGAAVSLPLLDAMIPALTASQNTAAKAVRRLAVVYHPNGVVYENWLPTGVGADFEFSRVLAPLEPFRDRVDHHHGSRRSSGGSARRRRRRSLARLRLVPDGRAREEVGHDRRELGVDGSDCGERVRARDAAVVAAAHRRQQQPGRIVRRGLQLRVQQHAVVADADAAADVGERSARRLRAPVRIERQHRSARAGAAVCGRTAAFSIR